MKVLKSWIKVLLSNETVQHVGAFGSIIGTLSGTLCSWNCGGSGFANEPTHERRRKGVRYRFESFPEDKLRKRSDTDTQQTTFETFPQALIKERHLIKKRSTNIQHTCACEQEREERGGKKRLKMTPKRGHRHKQWISQGTRKEKFRNREWGSDFVRKEALSFVTAVKSSMMMRVIYMMSSGDE